MSAPSILAMFKVDDKVWVTNSYDEDYYPLMCTHSLGGTLCRVDEVTETGCYVFGVNSIEWKGRMYFSFKHLKLKRE